MSFSQYILRQQQNRPRIIAVVYLVLMVNEQQTLYRSRSVNNYFYVLVSGGIGICDFVAANDRGRFENLHICLDFFLSNVVHQFWTVCYWHCNKNCIVSFCISQLKFGFSFKLTDNITSLASESLFVESKVLFNYRYKFADDHSVQLHLYTNKHNSDYGFLFINRE